MEVLKTIDELKKYVRSWKKEGLSIGLVPTMGYLHEGHKSLIDRAVAENDRVIVSDFVNPIQFAPNEDFAQYPRDIKADCALCENAGADIVFHPDASEMYPEDFTSFVDTTGVSDELCGKRRPTHFRGVCTVVNKLFNISEANRAYFGQKDAQQLAVIRRMVRDLNMNIQIIACPIIREKDGLAKSSRNTYLSSEERKAAVVLSRALFKAEHMIRDGERDGEKVLKVIKDMIAAEALAKIDYIEMVKWDSIEIHHTIDCPVLVALAVFFGKTRLIDNFIWEGEKA